LKTLKQKKEADSIRTRLASLETKHSRIKGKPIKREALTRESPFCIPSRKTQPEPSKEKRRRRKGRYAR